MLTSNARRISCDKVTCFGTNKCCSNRSHLPECCIKAPQVLCFLNEHPRFFYLFLGGDVPNMPDRHGCNYSHVALERVEKSPFSLLSMAASLVLFFFGHGVETSHIGDLSAKEFCQASGDFSLEQVGIDVSAPCTQESNSLDDNPAKHARMKKTRSLCMMQVLLAMFRNWKWLFWGLPISVRNSTNIALRVLVMHCLLIEETRSGILTRTAKDIFCRNVTCFGTNKCYSNRSHLPECCIKVRHFLLAMVLSFFTEHPRFFYLFMGGDVPNKPDCHGCNNSQVALERIKKCIVLFLVWQLIWFFSFPGMAWRLPIEEMYQHKNSVKQAETSHWNKLGLMYLPPAHMKVTHLATIRPNMQEWRKQGHFVWCGVLLQCSEIQSDSFEIFQSQFGNLRISPFEFWSCTAYWSKKPGAGMLTNNARLLR